MNNLASDLLERIRRESTPLRDFLTEDVSPGITLPKGRDLTIDESSRAAFVNEDSAIEAWLKPFHPTATIQGWETETPKRWIPAGTGSAPPALRRFLGKCRAPEIPLPVQRAGARVITPILILKPTFSLDRHETLVSHKVLQFRSTLADSEFLIAILNSTVSHLSLMLTCPVRSSFTVLTAQGIGSLPVPKLTGLEREILRRVALCRILAGRLPPKTADRSMAMRFFEQISDGLVFEAFFPDEVRQGLELSFFASLAAETLPEKPDDIDSGRLIRLFRQLFDRNHPVRGGVYFLTSIKSVRTLDEAVRNRTEQASLSESKGTV
jgi:hypothetical protein